MSEYTPTTAEVKQRYEDARYQFTPGRLEQTRAEFDRWLAEVERAAARKALWEAANRHQEQFGERVCELTLSTPTSRWLRAEAYRREEENDD